jgi:hypothetical protein
LAPPHPLDPLWVEPAAPHGPWLPRGFNHLCPVSYGWRGAFVIKATALAARSMTTPGRHQKLTEMDAPWELR